MLHLSVYARVGSGARVDVECGATSTLAAHECGKVALRLAFESNEENLTPS